jgi:hypothetical protein
MIPETQSTQIAHASIPEDIQLRLKAWKRLYVTHLWTHYVFGVLGVIASALSGFKLHGPWQQIFAGTATISIAIVGFVRPQEKYEKFVQAWRTLDSASTRYRHGLIAIEPLVEAQDKGEQLITEFERGHQQPIAPTANKQPSAESKKEPSA